ncbi:prepilin peptidase [Burkholderia sp. Bp8963]|uniref:A24 family peptidase n=1 Tax=Burkholderia sp. Bp8963 TaxID=2184547 RepID=UPI000F58FCC2|nr:A24 family peptidase [Burkholderia sp. Bp8963]RQS74425.1 prepilin peptidase [Burkholderia sp. Bp8963]
MRYLVQLAATIVLVSLAVQDLRARRLSNRPVLAFALLYFVAATLARDGPASVTAHVATGAAMLLMFGLFRHVGWLGGGDVKLAAAVFLWAGPALAFPVLTIVGVAGLATGIAMVAVHARQRRIAPARAVATHGVPGVPSVPSVPSVPYGVALALGGVFAVWAPFLLAAPIM